MRRAAQSIIAHDTVPIYGQAALILGDTQENAALHKGKRGVRSLVSSGGITQNRRRCSQAVAIRPTIVISIDAIPTEPQNGLPVAVLGRSD